MAEVTQPISVITGATLTATYDDVTLALVRFNLDCTVGVQVRLWRTGLTPWRDFALDPGSYQYDAGGPVQNWNDISMVELARL